MCSSTLKPFCFKDCLCELTLKKMQCDITIYKYSNIWLECPIGGGKINIWTGRPGEICQIKWVLGEESKKRGKIQRRYKKTNLIKSNFEGEGKNHMCCGSQ